MLSEAVEWAFKAMIILYVVGIGVTGVWTLTGHCCGSPLLGADWADCVPAGDGMWPVKWFASGHCDPATWKRVP